MPNLEPVITNFADRLLDAIERCGNPCLVGLDPHLELLPEPFAGARDPSRPRSERARIMADFCCEVIELIAGRVPAVKPQSAFFEVLGADGALAWERVVSTARAAGLLVIGDVKRGDIASTAAAYATAFLEGTSPADRSTLCDAVTLNPFLGADSIEPFVSVCARTGTGVFVLVRTSNPGSADFQRHGQPELSSVIAERVVKWGSSLRGEHGWSSLGAVVGATHGDELRHFRALMPHTPFLLPGYGAQGATARDIVGAFRATSSERPIGALVNSSRGITFAYRDAAQRGKSWQHATRDALQAMIVDLDTALRTAG